MGNAVAPHSGVFGLNGPQSVDRQGVDPFDAANVLNDKGWLSDPRQFEPEPPAAEADLSFSVPTDASSTAALSAAALSAASPSDAAPSAAALSAASPSWTPSDAAPSSAPAVRASSASADLKKKKRQASRRRKKKQKKSARAPAAGASAVPKEAAPASAHGGAPFVTTTTDGMVLLSRKLAGDRTIYIDCGPGGAMLRGGEGIAHRDMDNGNNHVDNLCSVREAEARKMLGAFAFVCDVCSASGEGVVLTRCGRCKARRYCGVACQRADWKRGKHKQVCGPPSPRRYWRALSTARGGDTEDCAERKTPVGPKQGGEAARKPRMELNQHGYRVMPFEDARVDFYPHRRVNPEQSDEGLSMVFGGEQVAAAAIKAAFQARFPSSNVQCHVFGSL